MQVNIWKIIYLNCAERYEDMIDHRSYTHNLSSCEIKAWKNSGPNGIPTRDLCDTSAVLYQLSYQANWELIMNIWKIIYLNCGERYEDMIDHRSYIHNLSSCDQLPVDFIGQLVEPQAAQTLYAINTWHYAVGNCVTILAVYKTMYENASKITLNATCRK